MKDETLTADGVVQGLEAKRMQNDTQEKEVMDCPFCGAEAEIIYAPVNMEFQIPCYGVRCKGCDILMGRTEGGKTEFFRTARAAADAWNRRKTIIHSRWHGDYDGYDPEGKPIYDIWSCGHCGETFDEWNEKPTWKYCPSCGAKMDFEVSDDEDFN